MAAVVTREERDACAAKLREVCVLMLASGERGPELAGWCLRMLVAPEVAERAVVAVDRCCSAGSDRAGHTPAESR